MPKGIKNCRSAVNDDNLMNALSSDEQEKNFTAVWPEFIKEGKVADNVVYSGTNGSGRHLVACDNGKVVKEFVVQTFLKNNPDIHVRFYLGTREIDKTKKLSTDVFASNPAGKQITSFDDQNLEGKTFYYLKPLPIK
jgi:hypothetical protein